MFLIVGFNFFFYELLGLAGVQVYKLSIGAACELKWPKERLIVQVLDDSTDPSIKVAIHFP